MLGIRNYAKFLKGIWQSEIELKCLIEFMFL